MKTKPQLAACLGIVALLNGGCARFLLPTPAQLNALAKDTNSIHIKVTSIYGNMDFDRNMGGTTVPVTTTFKVQPTQ